MTPPAAIVPRRALSIEIQGTVQGVGFRPFLFRLASDLGISGRIVNTDNGVLLEIEGPHERLEQFRARLRTEAPGRAAIRSVRIEPALPRGKSGISIEVGHSMRPSSSGTCIPLVPDLAPCARCLSEILAEGNRRYRYPFTSCSACGPRYSILYDLPYERQSTSFRDFPMCTDCAREYANHLDHRFHAESISCPRCGPQLLLSDAAGNVLAEGDAVLAESVRRLRDGMILALKGVGGFQLIADATNEKAVQSLRARKARPTKPFALLAHSIGQVRQFCALLPAEEEALLGPEAPIVLVRRLRTNALAHREVAPANPRLGVMLPASPLHALLSREMGRPLVATSGNRSGEPLCIDNGEARERLAGIADLYLVHDRSIVRPLDDSVIFFADDHRLLIRRARGFAPLSCLPATMISSSGESGGPQAAQSVLRILAFGAHLKNTVALWRDGQNYCSAHIGDLDTAPALYELRNRVSELRRLAENDVHALACDLHPDYQSTREALRMGRELGMPVYGIQHHHAHAMAVLAEADLTEERLVATWDGAGIGPDGTLWGGEFLLVDPKRGIARRAASLFPFGLPGGAAAFTDVRRAAAGLCLALGKVDAQPNGTDDRVAAEALAALHLTPQELRTWTSLVGSGEAPQTSSIGRLFDAVATLLGLVKRTHFEGEAAMLLQAAAEETDDNTEFSFPRMEADPRLSFGLRPRLLQPANRGPGRPAGRYQAATGNGQSTETDRPRAHALLDWRPMLRELFAAQAAGCSVPALARRFHNTLASGLLATVRSLGLHSVALGGGCFQNKLLVEQLLEKAREHGIEILLPHSLPPGDGAIAPGQAAVLSAFLSYGGR